MPKSPTPTSCRSDLFLELVDEVKRITPDCFYRTRFIRLWTGVNLDFALNDWSKQVPDGSDITTVREIVEEIKHSGDRNR